MKVQLWNSSTEGPLTELGLCHELERRGYRVTRYVYPPGTRFDEHAHAVDKIDAVVSGRFRIVLEGEDIVLEAGDAVEVPSGALHSAEVVGDSPVVSLDAVRV